MATLISCATGNWTATSTWQLVYELGTGVPFLDSEVGGTEVATDPSWGASATFTPGANIDVDGVALRVYSRLDSPSGTVSVCIGQGGSPVAGTTVTVNASDIPNCGVANQNGWMFFAFSAPVTLSSGTAYTVMAKESVAADNVFFGRDATASNWCRMIRTTTTQAPAAGDRIHVMGEWTAAGTKTDFTVTMNNADATDYGTGSTTLTSLGISSGGTLTWGTAASTNYQLRLSGVMSVFYPGTYNQGTTGTPIPSTSTALLEADCAAALEFGLNFYGTVNIQGNPLSYDRTYMAANATAGATSITVDDSTGWVNGDKIVISASYRTYSEYELKTVSSVVGTTINIDALTYNHAGVAPLKTEVILLTRNVKIKAVNASYDTYIFIGQYANVNIDWAEFAELGGAGGTANKHGFDILTTSGSANVQRSSFYASQFALYGYTATGSPVISYNVYHLSRANIALPTSGAYTFTYNWMIGFASTTDWHFQCLDTGSDISYNRFASLACYGVTYATVAITENGGSIGTISNNVIHSIGSGSAINIGASGGTVSDITAYFTDRGWTSNRYIAKSVTFQNITAFGCTLSGMEVSYMGTFTDCIFDNVHLNGYTGYTTPSGIVTSGAIDGCIFKNCAIGEPTGNYLDFTTSEIVVGSGYVNATFYNCTWGSATRVEWGYSTTASQHSLVRFAKDGGTEGNDYTTTLYGILTHNASEGIGATDCLELQPMGNTAYLDLSNYLDYGMFQAPAQDGVSRTVYIQLKDNVAWDGTNVSIALYQNGTKVVDWANKASTITTTYTEYSLTYTPTEDGVLDLAIKLDGDAGRVYADGFRWT